jgi:hypothetical protein
VRKVKQHTHPHTRTHTQARTHARTCTLARTSTHTHNAPDAPPGLPLPQGAWFWVEGVIDVFFAVDLVLNFYTAYEDADGSVVTGKKAIAGNYLKTWFTVDFLATFPADYIVHALQVWHASHGLQCCTQRVT